LADLTKQDVLLNELTNVVSLLTVLMNNHKSLREEKAGLEKSVSALKDQNSDLLKRVEALEKQLEENGNYSLNSLFGSLDTIEKEELKNKIQNLVNRIDFHLSS
jgi:predicted nuclease with TOPRIM domain